MIICVVIANSLLTNFSNYMTFDKLGTHLPLGYFKFVVTVNQYILIIDHRDSKILRCIRKFVKSELLQDLTFSKFLKYNFEKQRKNCGIV
jgi:hypothetical protein